MSADFKNAVKGRVPVIAVQTTELVHFRALVKHLTGEAPHDWGEKGTDGFPYGGLAVRMSSSGKGGGDPKVDRKTWDKNKAHGSTLVYFNLKDPHPLFTNLGHVECPPDFVVNTLIHDENIPGDELKPVAPALGGLNVVQSWEVLKMAKARNADGKLTSEDVLQVRRGLVTESQGVSSVDTRLRAYHPDERLAAFVKSEKGFFLDSSTDDRLRPRGLLLGGPPGTGKTQGAKYIASQWGVPLYRMDATVLNKYVGQSEGNLAAALAMMEAAEPCVFLIDEVEKLIAGYGSSEHGTVGRMLSVLLYWMQEHTKRVLTIMTTNNFQAIPPELYRTGRVDAQFDFNGVEKGEALKLATMIAQSYLGDEAEAEAVQDALHAALQLKWKDLPPTATFIAQATVEGATRQAIKELIAKEAV